MAETLTDSGAVKLKAGANSSTTITDDPVAMTQFINEAEGEIMARTRIDWITQYSGLDSNKRFILNKLCAELSAISVINYDMSGYTSRQEALTMLNVLWGSVGNSLKNLENADVKEDFVGGTS